MSTDSKFHTIPGRRDELHEQALYALFDGIRGNQERLEEGRALFARLKPRGDLAAVSSEQDPSAPAALRSSVYAGNPSL